VHASVGGFVRNVVGSFLVMVLGTVLGLWLGLAQLSHCAALRPIASFTTQLFRNSPWLVLLFYSMLLPFQLRILGTTVPLPDWNKATVALSLPIMANVSEIVGGAVNSTPLAQWESAESRAFTPRQTLWMIILPQCVKRMLPPWMNWYQILAMATPLISILDPETVKEVLVTIQELAAEGMTCILVTHEMRFAREVGDHIYFTDHGVIVEHGPGASFFDQASDSRTRQFLSQIL